MHDILNAYLENGLRVVLHKIPYAKTAACGLWVNQGSKYEIERTSGLSHLTEHLLVNPENRANEAYQKLMREIAIEGVFHNTSTTKESTSFYFAGLKSALKKSIELLAMIAKKNRTFSEELFENEKKVVLQEAISYYSSFNQIKERTSQALWGDCGIGKIIMGSMENIKSALVWWRANL